MSFDTNPCFLRRICPSKGFTLIEVLVAMAVFSSMLILGGIALNQGLKQYHGLADKGIGIWNDARKIWIDKSFNSALDYYVYKRGQGWFPYFKGHQEMISYVSLAPLAGELPVVAWIRNAAGNDGLRSLVYYELPVYTKSYEEIEREEIFGDFKKGKSVKLLEGVEGVEIRFYGYDILNRRFGWYSNFEGERMKILPSSVAISYQHEGKKDRLIFGVNVNSFLKINYNEMFIRP